MRTTGDHVADKIQLGIIGANSNFGWAPEAHLPAVVTSAEFELAAVCTTKQESADESARRYGARLAFHDYHDLLAHPEVEAVAVVLRVPSHFEPTRDAINAGKSVFTEWPLGRTTEEAVELTELARAKGVATAVGLQSRMNPALRYMRDLIADGYIGEVTSSHISLIREGVLERLSRRTWQRDVTLGANTMTIAAGHAIDSLVFVAGQFAKVQAVVSTQITQWLENDTGKLVDVTSPDNVLVSGRLESGAVASAHVASVPFAGRGYRLEVYGREGTLFVETPDTPQRDVLSLQAARGSNSLTPLEVPARYTVVSEATPPGSPYYIGQLYTEFAKSILSGHGDHPDFETAVGLHRLLDAVQQASDHGSEMEVPR
jgi:predicted dehydrogenase